MELRQGTLEWEDLDTRFTHTFDFASDHPTIDVVLQIMKEKIFKDPHRSCQFPSVQYDNPPLDGMLQCHIRTGR